MLGFFYVFLSVIIISFITNKLKLPLIIAYIFSGLLIAFTGLLNTDAIDEENLKLTSDLGLAFLLFIVGLKLDITSIKSMKNAFFMGFIKILVIAGLGFGLSYGLKFTATESAFISIGLSFCSTVVIVKILSDKNEIDSLPGKVAMGTLIVEDIAAVIALIVINIISGGGHLGQVVLKLITNIVALALIIFFISRYILPKYLKYWAKSHEFLMIVAIFFAVSFATLCEFFGLSQEVGAFIAGMMFAPYKEFRTLIASKLSSIRDMTLIYVFVYIGIQFKATNFMSMIPKILIFSAFAVIIKPVITYILMHFMQYKVNTSLKTGLILSQISEFSLIIVSMGIDKKLVSGDMITVLGASMIISTLLSSLLINYADSLTNLLTQSFKFKDFKLHKEKSFEGQNTLPISDYTNIIIGLDAFGSTLYDCLEENSKPVLGIDFNPINVTEARSQGKNVIYGDIHDIEFLKSLNLNRTKWLINAIPSSDHSTFIKVIHKLGFKGNYAAKADIETDTTKEDLIEAGANLVFEPFINAAKEAFDMILHENDQILYEKMKKAISKMENHYIICGFGRIGKQFASDFLTEKVPFVIIDNNPEHREELKEGIYYNLLGNPFKEKTLIEAGIKNAKGLIAVYPTDRQNIEITEIAKSINPDLTITARSILESNRNEFVKKGADNILSPYLVSGRKMASTLLRPNVFEFTENTYHGHKYDMVFEEVMLKENSYLLGKTIEETHFRQKYGVTILAIKRTNGKYITNPSLYTKFEKDDILIILANSTELDKLHNSDDITMLNSRPLED